MSFWTNVWEYNIVRTCAIVRQHVFEWPKANLIEVHLSGQSFWTSTELNKIYIFFSMPWTAWVILLNVRPILLT